MSSARRFFDGTTKSISGGLAHPVRYEYGPITTNGGGTFTKEVKLDANGDPTAETITTLYDMLGRPTRTIYGDGAFSRTFYNAKGQVSKEVDPDGVTTLYEYTAKGERFLTALDFNRDGVISSNGTDRITFTTNYVVNNGVADVHRTETRVWATNSTDSSTLISVTDSAVSGLTSWRTNFGLVTRSDSVFSGSGTRWSTNTAPDGTVTLSQFADGRALSVRRTNHTGIALSHTTFGYDEHGRQQYVTDARNGTTTNTFDAAGRVIARTTPLPGNGDDSQRTQYLFDSLGQIVAVTNSDNMPTYFTSLPTGERIETLGAREYPVQHTFDAQGRMTSMKTWQDYAGNSGTAITSWTNDTQRGWLSRKRYADGTGPDYIYTSAGRLSQRTWARGITTSYTMNNAGEVERITYSDGTTGNVTNTYDRRGRVTAIASGTNLTTRIYSEAGLLLSETQNGIVVSNRYDELQRRTNVAVVIGGTILASTGYLYDNASRLLTVTDGTNSATYSYVANSPLISQVLFQQNGTTRMTTIKAYDFLNRLLAITNTPSADSAIVFNYAHNSANQRTAITNADSARWSYAYDSLGQVTNGSKYWSDSTPVLGQQFGYLFDDIGNRRKAISGGDELGRGKRVQTYSANALNQYTSRTVPGYVDILGTATNAATVTVNSGSTSRKSDYYRGEIAVANTANAVWQSITNTAVQASGTNDYVTNWSGNLFIPQTRNRSRSIWMATRPAMGVGRTRGTPRIACSRW